VTVQEQRSVTTDAPTTTETGALSNRTVTSRRLDVRPSNNETTRRIVVLVFGLIQIVIGLRIVLLALDARTGNLLVSIINNLGGVLIAPFEGILRTNALASGGSVLDVAAVVALVGWTIVELIVIWSLASSGTSPPSPDPSLTTRFPPAASRLVACQERRTSMDIPR
jgi:hypothetical protein